MAKKLFILAPYPHGEAPSQRFRFEQYLDSFEAEGYQISFHPFLSAKTWKALYREGGFFKKAFGILGSFFRRTGLLFKLRKADVILIHREASMIGPPIFEWWIAKILRKPFIFDFDDAIWLPNYSDSNARFHHLKAYGKIKRIMRYADRISAGNQFLADYAGQYNENVHIIPTTLDLKNVHNQRVEHTEDRVIIGWTGTHTTMHYLEELIPVLQRLEEKYAFEFRVISNQTPDFELRSLNFVKWSKDREIEDLSAIQIGVMPLKDSIWAKGKCGFKALQYMSLGAAAVVSPIGVNTEIISNQFNGFLCETPDEWYHTLARLIQDNVLRMQIGEKARETVQTGFSVTSQLPNYLQILAS